MRRFILRRNQDISGVSGTGDVAEGILFSNGKVVLGWLGRWPGVTIFDRVPDMMAVHGHDGATVLVWVD